MSNPPFQRQQPSSPLTTPNHHPSNHQHHASRKPSIVELLSSPPPLPNNTIDDEIHQFSLSRNTSISSRTSSFSQQQHGAPHHGSNSHHLSVSGMDWSEIPLSELTESNKLIYINSSYSVQKAFETLVSNNLTSVPVSISSSNENDLSSCLTFDYSDLNTYLLLIMNKINLSELSVSEIGNEHDSTAKKHEIITQTINKAKRGEEVPIEFIIKLHPKNPFIKFTENDTLFKVMETLGNGVHRVAITNLESTKITGILSQRRLIKYMWENARRFPSLDFYLNSTLQDLKIGSSTPIFIYEDQLLIEALYKMFNERVSSLAVIDRTKSLIGNISIVDVKNVSSSKNSHLLFKSVLTFISYNLSQKGIEEGQDQYPIFHVNKQSSLGRVIAKLVATQSHRLWIVESNTRTHQNSISSPVTIEATLNVSANPSSASSSNANTPEGNFGLPGKLIGVVTLTDILGLFATSKGTKTDPQFARNQRRRSSTSTTRSSIDSAISVGDGSARTTNANADSEIFRKSYTAAAKNESAISKD
ncbi:predicted protein [Scheffersomyces stipitis CBS 6054]|uniref:Protein SDS23 n=1 Tax=Scheffersomyces stipitis (strain ATCC 58785 / CBS 6054 / NBRC 10063 / NRRL Y-11545) TaxID=322104 RepID=SDS23_PICST|nr:predicted protein [Scheffersomyces stipitis CBS 6054]A3LQC5.2 RecName: Full=Protein SDS23 [Scheffersomyces stipitis CBS 6054]ABN64657.2 predicted protein [Scheffersomyces stipitis CBS 6054]KAG2736394.1 hypothetical protein G9P44_000484 [Scheffersomyces stipitis]